MTSITYAAETVAKRFCAYSEQEGRDVTTCRLSVRYKDELKRFVREAAEARSAIGKCRIAYA